MKTALSLGLAATLGAFSLMGAPNDAHATSLNNAGSVCKNYDAADATVIDFLVNGVRNLASSAKYVICPLVRAPGNSTIKVHVDGYAWSGQTIFCTLYGYDNAGSILGSKSFAMPHTGTFDVSLSVPGKTYSNASVLCLLPPSGEGVLYDVDVLQ
jgi:hypothetical protein